MLRGYRILLSILCIGILFSLRFGSTGAFFSEVKEGIGNIFQSAESFEFDLLVNGQSNPSSVVLISNLAPGDDKVVEKIVRVNGSGGNAKVYVHLKDLESIQGSQTAPEIVEESQPTPGPKSDIHNYIDYDLTSNDTVIIDKEDQILLPDAVSCWIPLGTIPQNTDVSVLQSFHFHQSVTNWAQQDVLSFTEEFMALSTDAAEPGSPSGSDQIWDPLTNTCITNLVTPFPSAITSPMSTPLVGVSPTPTPSSEPFVDVVAQVAGTFGHCCDANNLSSDPSIAQALVTGAPDSPPDSDFIQISDNSSLTFEFVNNRVIDGVGADLRLHQYDNAFVGSALVEISDDCSTYQTVGIHPDTSDVDIDIGTYGLSTVRCVRVTDQVAVGDPYPTLGFDLDAIEALNSVPFP